MTIQSAGAHKDAPTHEQARLSADLLDAALLDPAIFCDRFCFIRGPEGATVPFRLWPFQTTVMRAFDDERRVLVLKARQLGISWLTDAYALWLCSANVGQTVLIFSKGLREAKEELQRIRFMHRRLPPQLKRRLGAEVQDVYAPDTTEQIEFPDMDSRIVSLPPTEHAGTSFTATLVIVQELAKIEQGYSLMAGVVPTMADGGGMIAVSTAKGYSGLFYEMWREAQDRLPAGQIVGAARAPGDFAPVFIPWHERPDRDQAWYDAISKSLSPRELRQEYPATAADSFQASGESVFSEEFDRQRVAIDGSRHPQSDLPVVHGVDPGVNNAVAYLIELQGDAAFVFAEIWLENQTVADLGQALLAADQEFGLAPGTVVTYLDPFSVGRNMHDLRTDFDVLRELGLAVDEDTARMQPSQRVDLIKLLLKQARLTVSLDCPHLLDALERAPWKSRRALGGERIREGTYAKDGKHEHCLIAGTLITTDQGDVSIEDIRIGDRVWTRSGWCPVVASGLTQSHAEVLQVRCADGRVVTGTPNHKIWTVGRGWVRFDALTTGDKLLITTINAGTEWKKWSTGGSSIDASQTTQPETCGSTSGGVMVQDRPNISIESFGKKPSGGQSRMDLSSITKMKTRRIMSLTISNAYLTQRTLGFIGLQKRLSNTGRLLPRSNRLQSNGTVLQKAGRGTASMHVNNGQNGSSLTKLANFVGRLSRRGIGARSYTVAPNVRARGHAPRVAMTNRESASCVAQNSSSIDPTEPKLVAGRVVHICPQEPRPVYDLTVAGAHEFFANGILVHNCLDALSSALAKLFSQIAPVALDTLPTFSFEQQFAYSKSEFG